MSVFLPTVILTWMFQFGGACGCEDKPQVNTLAVVNGVKIVKQELGSEAQNRITQLQGEVIKARETELNRQVNNLLLETEAKKRGLTSQQLLQLEVIAKVPEPTEAEIEAFYKERKQHIVEDYKTARPHIATFLKSEHEQLEALRLSNSLRASANLVVLIPNVTPPASEADFDRVFVTVNGQPITSRKIEEALMPLIYRVQKEVYNVRRHDLDLRINDMLLDQEARRRNTTPAAILTSEVRSRLPIITDQQARAFYDQNKEKIREDFKVVKLQILELLTAQEEQKLTSAFASRLRENAAVQIYLTPPPTPVFEISTFDQPTRGNPKAAVTVVEFTDFECSTCANGYGDLEKLIVEFGAQVKFVVRDFPLAQHTNALNAAIAAEAAREQNKYWEYAALLYSHQSALQSDDLKSYASQLGLDRQRFDASLTNPLLNDRVQRDITDGNRLAITSTPSFFINGRLVEDASYAGLKLAIQAALRRAN